MTIAPETYIESSVQSTATINMDQEDPLTTTSSSYEFTEGQTDSPYIIFSSQR